MSDEPEIDERVARIIWRGVGVKSARQIAAETGLEVDQVIRIRNQLKEEIDVLTVEQKQFRLINQLEEVANSVREKLEDVEDERNYAGLVNAFVNATKTVNVELRALEKKNSGAVEALNELRIREIMAVFYEVVDSSVPVIAAKYDLSEDDLFQVFNDALFRASARRELST